VLGLADQNITRLLNELARGRVEAEADVMPLVYDELRALASACFRRERADHTLQPTALVHEAWLRLIGGQEMHFDSRRHFYGLAAKAMRNILVNHARDRQRQKRGGGWDRIALDAADDTPAVTGASRDVDVLAIDEALTLLASMDERKARLVELRFFAGLSLEDAATVLDISRSVASDDWRLARAWLAVQLEGN
jgi:RNA polymerase sigma factor (TIGR02999 family)